MSIHFFIRSACRCSTGKVRENNEDNFYYNGRHLDLNNRAIKKAIQHKDSTADVVCYGIFDGMGGEEHGEMASYLAAKVFADQVRHLNEVVIPPKQFLVQACHAMNRRICEEMSKKNSRRMGSTAVILYFYLDEVYLCNIGDSRAYLLRDKKLIQLSVDHTEGRLMAKLKSDLSGSRAKTALTQHLGIFEDEMIIEPYTAKGECKPGDTYLICSDGLTDMLSDEEIERILNKKYGSERECIETLIDQALAKGGIDNTTAILCSVTRPVSYRYR